MLEYALLDMERDESRAAAIVSGALDILSLGIEVGTSGGIVSLGRKGGTEAAELAMREGLERMGTAEARKALRGMMARRVLTTGMEVAVQTAGPSAHRWAKAAYEDAFIKGVHPYQGPDGEYYAQLDAGHQRGSFWDAAPKAIAHGLVDNISERTGGLLLKWPGAQEAFAKMGTKAREELAKRAMLQLAIEKVGADKAVRFLSKSHEKLGMHGMHREILEEVDAAFGHALVDGKAPRFMSTDDVIDMMASMVLARGAMGAGGAHGERQESGVGEGLGAVSMMRVLEEAQSGGMDATLPAGNGVGVSRAGDAVAGQTTQEPMAGSSDGGELARMAFSRGEELAKGRQVAKQMQDVAQPGAFRRGPASQAKDLGEIVREYSLVPGEAKITDYGYPFHDNETTYRFEHQEGGVAYIHVGKDRVWVTSNDMRSEEQKKRALELGKDGHLNKNVEVAKKANESDYIQGGDLLYQAAMTYAYNHGLKFMSDDVVSDIAVLRRNSHMLSSALRHGTTRHLWPFSQTATANDPVAAGWKEGDSREAFEHNLELLANQELKNVAGVLSGKGTDIANLRYDQASDSVQQRTKNADGTFSEWQGLSKEHSRALLEGLDPGNSGVGPTTLSRALVIKSALDGHELVPNSDRDLQTQAAIGRGVGHSSRGAILQRVLGTRESREKLFYSRGESSSSERVQRTGVTRQETTAAEARLKSTAQGRAIYGNVLIVENRAALDGLQGRPGQQGYHAEDWDIMQDAEGFHDPRDGTVVIFRENVRVLEGETAAQAMARVVVHERVGHHGFDALRNSDSKFAEEWKKLAAAIPADQMKELEARYTHLNGNRDALALEWFAHRVGNMEGRALLEPGSITQRMWQAMRDWVVRQFSSLGDPSKQMTPEVIDAHVRGLIRATQRSMVKGGENTKGQGAGATKTVSNGRGTLLSGRTLFSLPSEDSSAEAQNHPNEGRHLDANETLSKFYLNGPAAKRHARERAQRDGGRVLLQSATRSIAQATASHPGTGGELDAGRELGKLEANALRKWAKDFGLMMDAAAIEAWLQANTPPRVKQGGEHRLAYDAPSQRAVKVVSIPKLATFTIYEYLTDHILCNRFLGDQVELEGFYIGRHHPSAQEPSLHVVVSQPWVSGAHPTHDEIQKHNLSLGFTQEQSNALIGSYDFEVPDVGILSIWDAKPDNYIKISDEHMAPIDVHFLFFNEQERRDVMERLEESDFGQNGNQKE